MTWRTSDKPLLEWMIFQFNYEYIRYITMPHIVYILSISGGMHIAAYEILLEKFEV